MSERDAVADSSGGRRRRRSWSDEDKRRIVAESCEPGASVAQIAQRHGINANLIFTWRRQRETGPSSEVGTAVKIVPMIVTAPAPAAPAPARSDHSGRMEIVLGAGERIIVGADVDTTALLRVVKALSRR
jgi:transposase